MIEKTIFVPEASGKISWLFSEFQKIAEDACRPCHVTGDDLAVRGLMWVVVRYEVELVRAFLSGEKLTLSTWASPFRHKMSQRSYLARNQNGDCILRAAGIWAVVDRKTRSMVDPVKLELFLPGEVTGEELSRPVSPKKLIPQRTDTYVVAASDLDMNGHMNNCRYFDLIQNCMHSLPTGKQLTRIQAVFINEARLEDKLTIHWGTESDRWFFSGEKEHDECFQIGLQFT